ncbi:MAG: DUF3404 domain-containing protein [bacterium]
MRLYLILIFTVVTMAFATGYVSLLLQRPFTASQSDILEINELKNQFQYKVKPLSVVNFNSLYFSRDQFQLLNPLFSIPESGADQDIRYSSDQDCFKNLKSVVNAANYEKVLVWEEFRCNKRPQLPRGFFVEPPYVHPSGQSYAFLAFSSSRGFQNKSWVLSHLQYFHVKELHRVRREVGELGGVFSILANLDEKTLSSIISGNGTVLTSNYLFARLKYPRMLSILEYRIYDRESLEEFLKDSSYTLQNYKEGRSCFYRDGELCWNYSFRHIFSIANKSTVIFFAGLLAVVGSLIVSLVGRLKSDRQEDERRRLALKVLSHEFRTPIASMLLIIESLSKRLNRFQEDEQEDILRLSADVYRLQRLTEMSRNYLKVKNSDRLIEFSTEGCPSINEFVAQIADTYIDLYGEDKVRLHFLDNDIAARIDTYWLGICLKNLIENACFHGQPPVDVRIGLDGKKLTISISDSGEVEEGVDLDHLTSEFVKGTKSQGSGLGLNIVRKVIDEMKAELILTKKPTTFTIALDLKSVQA